MYVEPEIIELLKIRDTVLEHLPEIKSAMQASLKYQEPCLRTTSDYWLGINILIRRYREGNQISSIEVEALKILKELSEIFDLYFHNFYIGKGYVDDFKEAIEKFSILTNVIKKESHLETQLLVYIQENIEIFTKSNLGKRDKQIKIICLIAEYFEYELLEIPDGGKKRIKEVCDNFLHLFQTTSFNHAWGVASESNILKTKV
jgi:hypothetical protein